jgi:hypothetical protein
MGVWIMAVVTLREAARRRILWTALVLGLAFLTIFAFGLRIQNADAQARMVPPFLRYQILHS